MLRLLRFLWTGQWHQHTLETIKEVDVNVDGQTIYTRYYCRCKTCGEIKIFNP